MGGKLVGYLLYTLADGEVVGFKQAKIEVTVWEGKEQAITGTVDLSKVRSGCMEMMPVGIYIRPYQSARKKRYIKQANKCFKRAVFGKPSKRVKNFKRFERISRKIEKEWKGA